MNPIVYLILLCFAALPMLARTLDVLSLPISIFPDTEVSTNIPLRIHSEVSQIFDLEITTICTPSNAFQVAFGCDSNTDNILSPEETELVYGWRGGRWIVEDVQAWERQEVPAVADGSQRTLAIHFETHADSSLHNFQIACDNNSLFMELSSLCPARFFNFTWNLMRITRRGELSATDSVHLSVGNKGTLFQLR